MGAYKSRTKGAIEAYRKWLDNPGSSEWKPKVGGSRPAKKTTTASSSANGVADPISRTAGGGHVPSRAALVEYPYPLRPGVHTRLVLPEDLTEKEAKRLVRFVESLAIAEPLAITSTGETE